MSSLTLVCFPLGQIQAPLHGGIAPPFLSPYPFSCSLKFAETTTAITESNHTPYARARSDVQNSWLKLTFLGRREETIDNIVQNGGIQTRAAMHESPDAMLQGETLSE